MEAELLEAQERLVQKRKHAKVVFLPQPTAAQKTLSVIFPITAQSGLPRTPLADRCRWHPGEIITEDDECPVCQEQREAETAAQDKAKKREFERLLGGIRLGKRYQGVTFNDYVPTCAEAVKAKAVCLAYAQHFAERAELGSNLLLLGNPGTGKNMLAAAICNHLASIGVSSLHTTAMKLVRRIRETWGKDKNETEQQVIDSFTLPGVLVVDEIGKQFDTKGEKLLLFEAINGRYEAKMPTVLISNFSIDQVKLYLDDTLMDRFYEGKSSVLAFTWGSYRRQA